MYVCENMSVCVCVFKRTYKCVCVSVCESVCESMCVHVCLCVCIVRVHVRVRLRVFCVRSLLSYRFYMHYMTQLAAS